MAWNGVGVVLEWLGVAWNSVEGVRGCWSAVGAALKVLECNGGCWRGLYGVGVVLEWFGVFWNSVGGC